MAPKLLVILGITGNQGASVADAFLGDPNWRIRGISRDTSKTSSKVWSDKGVEMVAADQNDVESLKAAVKGANVLYGVTDFWAAASDPEVYGRAQKENIPINEILKEIEIQLGRNVIDAAASTVDTLELFIWSTLSHTEKWSNGEITYNLHFDAKQGGEQQLGKYPELKKKTSFLQVGLFMFNWKSNQFMEPHKKDDGSYFFRIPMRPEAKLPFVNPRWDVGAFVRGLTQVPPGKTLLGVAEWSTWQDYAEEWGKANGVTCTYEQGAFEEADEAIPGGIGKELGEMFRYFDTFGYTGGDPDIIEPKDLGVEVRTTPLTEYMKREDWSQFL